MADAGIASWDAKFAYNLWRPVTAIRKADTDGNPDTDADPNWTPLLNTPPFPEYISGHSTFSSAAARVLASFYGTDHVSFTTGSDTLPGVFRTYESFEDAAEEIGLSRIYGGIHFLSADLDGLAVGHQIGEHVFQNFLRPLPERAALSIVRSGDGGRLQVDVMGTMGRVYVLETSSNLDQWTPLLTNPAPFTLEAPWAALTFRGFYRAVPLTE